MPEENNDSIVFSESGQADTFKFEIDNTDLIEYFETQKEIQKEEERLKQEEEERQQQENPDTFRDDILSELTTLNENVLMVNDRLVDLVENSQKTLAHINILTISTISFFILLAMYSIIKKYIYDFF